MQDFLTFKTFVSPTVLIVMYIFGALIMPLIAWLMAIKVRKYLPSDIVSIKNNLFSKMSSRDKSILIGISLLMLLCMEICWRMLFEFLIAYMQIRDVLVGI